MKQINLLSDVKQDGGREGERLLPRALPCTPKGKHDGPISTAALICTSAQSVTFGAVTFASQTHAMGTLGSLSNYRIRAIENRRQNRTNKMKNKHFPFLTESVSSHRFHNLLLRSSARKTLQASVLVPTDDRQLVCSLPPPRPSRGLDRMTSLTPLRCRRVVLQTQSCDTHHAL